MTVGLCVPSEPKRQREFISDLSAAGLAGMLIGDHEVAPTLSSDLLEEADKKGFPVVFVGESTPFAVVARHVAAANTNSQALQVLQLSKIYQVASSVGHEPEKLLTELAALMRVGFELIDPETGLEFFSANPLLGVDMSEPKEAKIYTLHGQFNTQLRIREFPGEMLDSFLLVHLLKLIEVSTDRLVASANQKTANAARMVVTLLTGGSTLEARDFFGVEALSDGLQIAAFPIKDKEKIARLVYLADLKILVGSNQKVGLAILSPNQIDIFREIAAIVKTKVGISSNFKTLSDARMLLVEAEQALSAIDHSTSEWSEYRGTNISLLARSQQEALQIINEVLGPLASNDEKNTLLRTTLFTFLKNDRKWLETANELGIHRQTLAYRLNRIDNITNLTVATTSGISSLWIAYKAWEKMHGPN
jgi:purine catabolism regulator